MQPYIDHQLPISVKAIVIENGRIWLRKNPRNEWELPGGRLEAGEQPVVTIFREIQEELGFEVNVGRIVHSGVLDIKTPNKVKSVFIVSYTCNVVKKIGGFELQGEDGAAEFCSFTPIEVNDLAMPPIYKEAIELALG